MCKDVYKRQELVYACSIAAGAAIGGYQKGERRRILAAPAAILQAYTNSSPCPFSTISSNFFIRIFSSVIAMTSFIRGVAIIAEVAI